MLDAERVAAWVNLSQATHVIQAALDERLEAAAGISGAEFDLLWRLGSTPDRRLNMSAIAGLLLASRSGVTRLVERLVDAGLVTRSVPFDNRRVAFAELTPRGAGVLVEGQVAFAPGVRDRVLAPPRRGGRGGDAANPAQAPRGQWRLGARSVRTRDDRFRREGGLRWTGGGHPAACVMQPQWHVASPSPPLVLAGRFAGTYVRPLL